jgi:hypothetical protein
MRKLVLGIAALVACAWGSAAAMAEDLEVLDPQIAQAFAQALVPAAEKIEKLQVKVEADTDKACGVHKEQTGLILVPQKDIQPENDAVNKDPGAPLAHLFMSPGFAPVIDGKPLDAAKMRSLTIMGQDGNEHKVSYLTLAARHTDDDAWHLYGYGTDDKPLLDARIGEGAGPGTQPLALEVKDFEDGNGTAYVTIFDRFQCSFKINFKGE